MASGSASTPMRRQPTATLRATPLDLLRLLNAEGVSGVNRTHAELKGDLQVAERYAQLLKLARPDLEEEVSKWFGDVPAHALGDVVRGAGAWLARAAGALRMNTAEYLQEESRAMPAPLEAQAFYARRRAACATTSSAPRRASCGSSATDEAHATAAARAHAGDPARAR